MSTFVLINSTRVGTAFYFAGQTLSDALHPTSGIAAAGGILVATGNSAIDAAAAKCESFRKYRGADAALCDSIMFASMADSVDEALVLATTTRDGLMSAVDKIFFNGLHAAKGTNLTDTATQTIDISGGTWRVLPTLSQGGTLTVDDANAVAGDQITITRRSAAAFTYAIVNGGAGAGTLLTMPASTPSFAKLQFDGTDWEVREMGSLDT